MGLGHHAQQLLLWKGSRENAWDDPHAPAERVGFGLPIAAFRR